MENENVVKEKGGESAHVSRMRGLNRVKESSKRGTRAR